jgi:hypothetical protein
VKVLSGLDMTIVPFAMPGGNSELEYLCCYDKQQDCADVYMFSTLLSPPSLIKYYTFLQDYEYVLWVNHAMVIVRLRSWIVKVLTYFLKIFRII